MCLIKHKVDPWVQKEDPNHQSDHNAGIMREAVYQVRVERTRALESHRLGLESFLGESLLVAWPELVI